MAEDDCQNIFSSYEAYFQVSVFIIIVFIDIITFRLLLLWKKVFLNSLYFKLCTYIISLNDALHSTFILVAPNFLSKQFFLDMKIY